MNFDITWVLAGVSIAGTILNIKKKFVCFYIWVVANIFWLVFDIRNGIYGRAFLDVVHLGFAFWGIYEWQFKNKEVSQ